MIRRALLGVSLGLVAVISPVLAQTSGTGVGSQFELVFWQSVATSDDIGQYEAYLARYPEGTFAPLARAKIDRLRPAASPAPRPAPPSPAPTTLAPPALSAEAATVASAPMPPVPIAPPVAILVATPSSSPAPVPAPSPGIAIAPLASAPAVAPSAATTPAVVVPVAPPAEAVPAAAPAAAPSLAEQLAALAHSQGSTTSSTGGGTGGAPRSLPAPPALPAPDPVILPGQFCSAVDRNAFYDERFRPSKDAADENNRRAIAHLQTLQRLYDQLGQQGDPDGQNAVAAESKAYQGVAASAYQASAAYEQLFQRMMAVPIADCTPPATKTGRGA